MNKSIEDRVKDIVETNELLSLKEKSEIICLIECYKGSDLITKQIMNERYQLQNKIDQAIKYIKTLISDEYGVSVCDGDNFIVYEPDWQEKLLEILKDSDVDE